MIKSNEIHQSMIDASDLEQVRESNISVGDVFRSLARHPTQIIKRWNWKSAVMGALLRASFYFVVYKASRESWLVTFTAIVVEFGFRFFTSGVSGALVQSFRRANPVWLATLIVTVSLPLFGHAVEYVTHYMQEAYFSDVFAASQNKGRQKAFAVSVLFSVLSALFSIFMMRSGVLLVGAGEETNSFLKDLRKMPSLVLQFVIFLPIQIINFIKEKNIFPAIGIFLAFGLAVGGVLGVFRGKWSWAWKTALGAWMLLFVWTIFVTLVAQLIERRKKG